MDVEALFLRFREQREPDALGAVFDRVADELYGVALHVSRDATDAEDLVQATFLVAIERARRWDSSRPLRPWLLGILHKEATARRRRARRTPDPSRLPVPAEAPPVETVLAGETAVAVAHAIAKVPQPYRDVLELRLVQSLSAVEIAERLRRSPGAVRTQVWRGLELLRRLLPRGLALALPMESGLQPRFGEVRERVIFAAERKLAVGNTSALTGAWIMSKIGIGVAAAAVLAAGWLVWPHQGVVEPSTGAGPTPAVGLAQASDGAVDGEASTSDRVPLMRRDPRATAPASEPGDREPPPRIAHLLVVDQRGDPVVDAEVGLYEPDRVEGRDAAAASPGRMPGAPFWKARTDIRGGVQCVVDRELFVAARMDGVGASGDLRLEPDMAALREPWRIVLFPLQHIRGVVLRPDGSPANGARVDCHHTNARYLHLADRLPGVIADAEGRFAFEVLPDLDYRLRAQLDGRSARADVDTRTGNDEYEVRLQFPGAFSVRGRMFDAEGNPIAGRVLLLSTGRPDQDQPRRTEAGVDGRFELLSTQAGRFELVGGVEGQTAAHVPIVLDTVRPHAVSDLRLTSFVALSGRVIDEQNRPQPNLLVAVSPLCERDAVYRACAELQGTYPRGPTAADGTFHFAAPAGVRYRVTYRATPTLWADGIEVMPPATNVVLVARDSDKQGFTVTGRVVDASTGAPLPGFSIHLVTHSGSGSSDSRVADGADGGFTAGPFPIGRRYSLRCEAPGHGTVTVGPFDATLREEQIVFRLPKVGGLVCTVLRADGSAAIRAHVSCERKGDHPFERGYEGITDAEGRIVIDDIAPDEYVVHAQAEVSDAGAADEAVVIHAGQQTTLVLTLRR